MDRQVALTISPAEWGPPGPKVVFGAVRRAQKVGGNGLRLVILLSSKENAD